MQNDFENIDKLYRDKLKDYSPAGKARKSTWLKLAVKILILNLSVSAVIGATVSLLVISGIAGYFVYERYISKSETDGVKNIIIPKKNIDEEIYRVNRLKFIEPTAFQTQTDFTSLNERPGDSGMNQASILMQSDEQQPDLAKESSEDQVNKQANNPFETHRHNSSEPLAGKTAIDTYFNPIIEIGKIKKHGFGKVSSIDFISQRSAAELLTDSLFKKFYRPRKLTFEVFLNPSIVLAPSSKYQHDQPHQVFDIYLQKSRFSAGAGFNLRYHTGKWYFATGINYSLDIDKGTYSLNNEIYDPNLTITAFDSVFSYIYDPPNLNEKILLRVDTIGVPGYRSKINNGSWEIKNYIIELPFMTGFIFDLHPLEVEISTGISIGMLVRQSGGIPHIDNTSELAFREIQTSQAFFNYMCSAGITYPLKEHFRISVKPNYKYNLNRHYTGKEWPFGDHFNRFGIRAGFIFDL